MSAPRDGFVQARGARLRVREDAGPAPDAPVLLLSNSLAASMRMWDPQVPLLTRRYRLLRYDTRGHGESEAPAGDYDFPLLVEDMAAVLDSAGVARAAVMGLSLGGMTALGFALAHPARVERLVCCDARADAPPPFVASWDERLAATAAGGMAAVLDTTLDRWLDPGFRAARPDVAAWVGEMIVSTPVAGYAGCAAALKRLAYLPELHRISAPTLFVRGDSDGGAPAEAMRAMAAQVSGALFAEVPQARHLPNLDNEAGFARAISGFLGLS
jgi:3-oxoadipate enol-lactonase